VLLRQKGVESVLEEAQVIKASVNEIFWKIYGEVWLEPWLEKKMSNISKPRWCCSSWYIG
jgi:hypothetical protein